MELKYELEGAFNAFIEDHLEFTEEHKDISPGIHKPRYSYIDTTAEEEFKVHSLLSTLNNKELCFLYALMNQKGNEAMEYAIQETDSD